MKYFFFILLSLITFSFAFQPLAMFAQTNSSNPGSSGYQLIIKCSKGNALYSGSSEKECTFADVVDQINHIINFLFYISAIIATIAFIYCGFLFLTDGGSGSKTKKAREVFFKVVIGFFWVFAAWLVVHFITSAFSLNAGYSLIQ